MAKVHDFLEIWQGSDNLQAIQRASHAQNKQMTAMGYISDTEETVKASWFAFKGDGVAALKMNEKSPLPPSISHIDLPGGKTKLYNIHRI
jgi:hypothetical protein